MCDTYNHKCYFCENGVSLHIADWCTGRENISVICPDCQERRALSPFSPYVMGQESLQVFADIIMDRKQIDGKLKSGRYKGRIVLILCKDPNAYGIHLN